jgi:CrcB protein
MTTAVAIAGSGALGALARYGLEGAVGRHAGAGFPWGTFVVNVTGSLAVGFLFTVLIDRGVLEPWQRTALLVGFLGAYTTFSTLSLETYRLLEDGAVGLALDRDEQSHQHVSLWIYARGIQRSGRLG